MTPDQLARAFERFYRANDDGSIPGTGLGLPLVKEIIEIHRGLVELNSHIAAGTEATVLLPVAQGNPSDVLPAIASSTSQTETGLVK